MRTTQADPLPTLRQRTSEKWRMYPADALPMFVAEMDFGLAPEIKAALHEAVDRGDTGYVSPRDTGALAAFAGFARDAWGWAPSVEHGNHHRRRRGHRRIAAPADRRVALAAGPAFGPPGAGHARMNVACAPETIVEAVDRLARAAT